MRTKTRMFAVVIIIAIFATLVLVALENGLIQTARAQQGVDPSSDPTPTEPPPPSFATITIRDFTDEERAAYLASSTPKSARSEEETENLPYGDFDVTVPEGVAVLAIAISEPAGAVKYRIERRIVEPDDSATSWQILEDIEPPDGNLLVYEDLDGMPTFEYKYRITKITNTGTAPSIEKGPHSMYSVRKLYGFGDDSGAHIRIKRRTWDANIRYRIWRYSSRTDTSPTQVGVPVSVLDVIDPQPAGFYRYKVEYVKSDGNGGWSVEETTNEVILKVEDTTLGLPSYPSAHHPPDLGVANLSWIAPNGIHRANFGIYEVLRRNAKDIHDQFQIIGSTPWTSFTDKFAVENSHFDYAVRVVSWDHQHGGISDIVTAPVIPLPQCTVLGGETVNVGGIELTPLANPPVNSQFTFSAWITASDGERFNMPCVEINQDDWYVKRSTIYQHIISEDCPTEQSCDRVGGDSGVSATPYTATSGYFRTETSAGSNSKALVWYDEPESQPGLYRHNYRFCSYATQNLCQEHVGNWDFEGVESVPFMPEKTE